MRCVELGEFGLDSLRFAERPAPEPGPGQVRLQVLAASLNYRDLLMIRGHYDPRLALPIIPLSDGVGRVDAVGPGVRSLAVGDRVCPLFAPTWIDGGPTHDQLRATLGGPHDGLLCEQFVTDESAVRPAPAHLSDAEAATLPCAALTAWSALAELGSVGPGDTVLTLGSGGVSVFAIQFAQALGARVIATTTSPHKMDTLRALGADVVIDASADPGWGRTIRRQGGVDHVVEVGGAGTLQQSLDAVRVGGTVSLIGVLAGVEQPIAVTPILMKQLRVQGVFVGNGRGFERMAAVMESHAIHPVVDRIFEFEDSLEALRHLEQGGHVGKVVIQIASPTAKLG